MNRIAKIALAGAAFGLFMGLLTGCTTVRHEKVIVHDSLPTPHETFNCTDGYSLYASECQDLLKADEPVRQRI